MIKAIIFDMDGVLIDAKDWHYRAFNKALRHFGYEINYPTHLREHDGLPTKKKLEILSHKIGLPKKLHILIDKLKQEYTVEEVDKNCRPTYYHKYALSRLKDEGYKLAIASNSIRLTVELMVKRSELKNYFDILLSNQDVDRPKPFPDIYKKAINLLQAKPEECIIIEDNENGIQAARESGANVMVVQKIEDVTYANIKSFIAKVSCL